MSTIAGADASRASSAQHVEKTKPKPKHTSKPAPVAVPTGSFFGYAFSTVARIFAWYSIYLLLFQCPATLDACDAESPFICKPYFQAKQAVAPHAARYIDAYAGPYVDMARPYYETVDRAVISPARAYAITYGAPRLEQAHAYGRAQWDSVIQPRLAEAQEAAADKYNQVLGPHVDKLVDAVGPYYEIARVNALQTKHEIVLPAYEFLVPFAVQGYEAAAAFTTNTLVPGAIWAYGQTAEFVGASVVPRLRVLYAEQVEPQLEKMGLKITLVDKSHSSHRTAHTTAPSSFSKPVQASASDKSAQTTTTTTTTATTTATSVASTSTTATTPTPATSDASSTPASTDAPKPRRPDMIVQEDPEPNEDDVRLNARKEVAEDLRMWQDKYAKAADEGAVEIEKRIGEITKRAIRRNARTVGQGHVDALQETIASHLAALRQEIREIVDVLKADELAPEAAEAQIVAAVRQAGVAIKDKAQAVRTWHAAYDQELRETVSRAAENHFQILGGIRDLALQKIGMKWAWMDGVTYKDWAKYHLLKNRFEEWESDLEQLIVTHPGLDEAQTTGQALVDEAMDVAAAAAHELARLKRASNTKIELRDSTDEFDEDTMRANAEQERMAREAREAEAAAAAAAAEEERLAREAQAAEAAAAEQEQAAEEAAAASGVSDAEAIEIADAELAAAESAAGISVEAAETVAPEEVSSLLDESTAIEALVSSASSVSSVSSETAPDAAETVDPAAEATEAQFFGDDEIVEQAPLEATPSTNTETDAAEATASSHDEL